MSITKELRISLDIISKYHPNKFVRDNIVKYHKDFCADIPKLVELCYTHRKFGLKYVDEDHYDFDDYSDSKTASISRNPRINTTNIFEGYISGVSSGGGNFKVGALRCVLFNPHHDSLSYYFFPGGKWEHLVTSFYAGRGTLKFTYNIKKNHIKKIEDFQVSCFEELALAR